MDANVPPAVVTAKSTDSYAYFPIAFFGSVMGLTGLSSAWHLAHERYGAPVVVSQLIGALALIAFVLVAIGYGLKLFSSPQVVRAEFAHPIVGNLFGTLPTSLLLLPMVVAPLDLTIARAMWAVGAVGMIAFGWFTVDRWMSQRQKAIHATPAWIIPVVGLLDVPLAMPALGLQDMHGLMMLGLAVGLFFTTPLFTMIFSRLLFEEPLPDGLQPSLLILLAPFAVGTSAYITTTGQVDLVAQCLFALTVFMLAVLVGRLRFMARCCPFRVAWWAVGFPLAAASIAALRIAGAVPGLLTNVIAIALLALVTLVISGLLIRTLVGVARGELKTLSA